MTFEIAVREKWSDRLPLPTISQIKEYVSYDSLTGLFEYKNKIDSIGRLRKFKTTGGKTKRGYIKIRIAGKSYSAHRIAYKLGRRNYSINNHNRKSSNNKILPKGVRKHLSCNKFESRISVNGKSIYLGLFSTVEKASLAYNQASQQHYKD